MTGRLFAPAIGLAAMLVIAGCSNTLPLHYVATERALLSPATLSVVQVVDKRGEPDPTWYGAIRGGYGNPLKTLHSDKPIDQTVQDALVVALAARGIRLDRNASAPSLMVTVAAFEADRVIRSEVAIRLDVVVKSPSGDTIYSHETSEDRVKFGGLGEGIFADPKDLQAFTQSTMDRAINEAIDAPGFLAAITAHQRSSGSYGDDGLPTTHSDAGDLHPLR